MKLRVLTSCALAAAAVCAFVLPYKAYRAWFFLTSQSVTSESLLDRVTPLEQIFTPNVWVLLVFIPPFVVYLRPRRAISWIVSYFILLVALLWATFRYQVNVGLELFEVNVHYLLPSYIGDSLIAFAWGYTIWLCGRSIWIRRAERKQGCA